MYSTYVKTDYRIKSGRKSKKRGRVKSHQYRRWLVKIELNGKEVFVSSEFTKDIYHVTADLLNVRSESNTESKILGRLKKDDVIESTNQVKDGWLQFEYKGKQLM